MSSESQLQSGGSSSTTGGEPSPQVGGISTPDMEERQSTTKLARRNSFNTSFLTSSPRMRPQGILRTDSPADQIRRKEQLRVDSARHSNAGETAHEGTRSASVPSGKKLERRSSRVQFQETTAVHVFEKGKSSPLFAPAKDLSRMQSLFSKNVSVFSTSSSTGQSGTDASANQTAEYGSHAFEEAFLSQGYVSEIAGHVKKPEALFKKGKFHWLRPGKGRKLMQREWILHNALCSVPFDASNVVCRTLLWQLSKRLYRTHCTSDITSLLEEMKISDASTCHMTNDGALKVLKALGLPRTAGSDNYTIDEQGKPTLVWMLYLTLVALERVPSVVLDLHGLCAERGIISFLNLTYRCATAVRDIFLEVGEQLTSLMRSEDSVLIPVSALFLGLAIDVCHESHEQGAFSDAIVDSSVRRARSDLNKFTTEFVDFAERASRRTVQNISPAVTERLRTTPPPPPYYAYAWIEDDPW